MSIKIGNYLIFKRYNIRYSRESNHFLFPSKHMANKIDGTDARTSIYILTYRECGFGRCG